MKFLETFYSKTFTISTPFGDQWEKVGFKITSEGETPEEILTAAHDKAQAWHMSNYKPFNIRFCFSSIL